MDEVNKFESVQEEIGQGTETESMNCPRKQNWKFFLGILAGLFIGFTAFMLWRGYFTIEIPLAGVITVKLPTYGLFGDTANGIDQVELNRKIDEINFYMENEYYYDQKKDGLEDAAVSGIYAKYTEDDDYADYFTKEEYLKELEGWQGSFVGIGIYVIQDEETGGVRVVRPIKGGPGMEAGIIAGDVIIEADGVNLCGMDLETATRDYLKGEEGTSVKLTVLRDGETFEVTVNRRLVNAESVYYSVMQQDGKDIGYIYISQFLGSTYENFLDAVDSLCLKDVSGIVIDLRDDTGGDMNVCLNMADYILPDSNGVYSSDDVLPTNQGRTRLLTIASKNGNKDYYYAQDTHQVDVPIVIIVNGYSASASEIFAGIMKSYGYPVCGVTTYGKGIVQTVRMLYDMSGIKYTSAEYVLPDGSKIHGVGIEPDRLVEPSETLMENGADPEKPNPETDNMLSEAIRLLGE